MKFHALQAQFLDPLQLLQSIFCIRVYGTEGHDGRIFVHLRREIIDLCLLLGVGCNGKHHRNVHTVFSHLFFQRIQGSVGLGLHAAGAVCQLIHSSPGDPRRECMSMKIDQHIIHLLIVYAL